MHIRVHFIVRYIAIFLAAAPLICGALPSSALAQTPPSDAVLAREAQLRAELDAVLKDIAAQQTILDAKRKEGASFQKEIDILNAQIKQAELQIKAHDLAIRALGRDITQKNETINQLETRITKNKESLAQLLVKTNQIDSSSMVEVMLGDQSLSDFFADIDSFDVLKSDMRVLFNDLRSNKQQTQIQKDSLLRKQLEETAEKISVESERSKIKVAQDEKKRLLSLSKQEQANYQAVINVRERKAAEIRSALFALRDTSAIPFGQALQYAQQAQQVTGVRAAFILGILTQESNLGKNTGSCILKNTTTGGGVGANTGTPFAKVMNPTRDVPVYITLLAELGRDPFMTKVSCPQSIGWGGAMGPAQFIPSTWNGMKSKIAAGVGKAVPDPWDPKDAIMASALFLKDLGAAGGNYAAEQEAAGRYYAGAGWATRGLSYARSVAQHATNIQNTMINPLQGN